MSVHNSSANKNMNLKTGHQLPDDYGSSRGPNELSWPRLSPESLQPILLATKAMLSSNCCCLFHVCRMEVRKHPFTPSVDYGEILPRPQFKILTKVSCYSPIKYVLNCQPGWMRS